MHVVLTAMDAGAAHQIAIIAEQLRDRPGTSVSTWACDAAARVFDEKGLRYQFFDALPRDVEHPTLEEHNRLIERGREIVAAEQPSLVLGGITNKGNGPDEAIAAAARAAGRATSLVLDDFGPLFTVDGRHADHLLATSRPLYEWARSVGGSTAHLIGSPKHHALSVLPVDDIRRASRRARRLDDGTRLIAFIAQNDRMTGHNDNFRHLAQALAVARHSLPPFRLVVRVHPGAPDGGYRCYDIARKMNLPVECDEGKSDILSLLAASDALFSVISTSLIDYVWMALGGTTLRAVPVYLLIGEDIRDWLVRFLGRWRPDLVDRGYAHMAGTPDDLQRIVRESLNGTLRAPSTDPAGIRDVANPFATCIEAIERIGRRSVA